MEELYGQYSNKSRPKSVWGIEKTVQSDPDSFGLGATGGTSETAKNQPLANDRKNRAGRNIGTGIHPCIAKKILDQLIEDTRDQLEKSRECIDWYIRESAEYEEKLKSLNELRALAESDANTSQSP